MTKLLLLDLDLTVRRCKSNPQRFINEPADQELIEGAGDAIARYAAADGWEIIGVTNQGGVQAGFKSLIDCISEQRYTLTLCPELAAIYFCPDNGMTCYVVNRQCIKLEDWSDATDTIPWGEFRKPQPGMLNKAIFDVAGYFPAALMSSSRTLKLEEILYVGDRPEDRAAAAAAGVDFIRADDWRTEQ